MCRRNPDFRDTIEAELAQIAVAMREMELSPPAESEAEELEELVARRRQELGINVGS